MDVTPERLRELARSARRRAGFDPALPAAHPEPAWPVKTMPSWVGRVVVLSDDPADCWLWCEARAEPTEAFPSQFVLDVPPGRYFVDTYDATTSSAVARESAEGGPLVAGLCCLPGPVLVNVRRVWSSAREGA
jgi:hypothetical protein